LIGDEGYEKTPNVNQSCNIKLKYFPSPPLRSSDKSKSNHKHCTYYTAPSLTSLLPPTTTIPPSAHLTTLYNQQFPPHYANAVAPPPPCPPTRPTKGGITTAFRPNKPRVNSTRCDERPRDWNACWKIGWLGMVRWV
jgi:hypothetical protein